MPKIPQYESEQLPGSPAGVPQYQNQNYSPAISLDQAAAPWKAVGHQIGDKLSEFQAKLEKAQQANEYANLSVAATKELHEMSLKYHLDTDYKTLSTRYAAEAQQTIKKYLDQAVDPEVKNHLTLKLGNDYASGITSIGNVARRGVVDQLTADTLARYEERKRLAASQTDELAYNRIIAEQQGDIDGMIHAGVLKAEEGQKMKNKFRHDVEALQINQMKFGDPYGTVKKLQDPNNFPNASPEFKQKALESATRQIDILDRRAISEAERAERKQDKDIKVYQTSNFARMARKNASEDEVYKALESRQIDESHALRLMDRRQRDIDADVTFADKQIDSMFRTTGPLESLDAVNETYRASLKRELNERVFNKENPELPMTVLDDIMIREKDRLTAIKGTKINNSPTEAYPRPRFYDSNISLDEIKKRTVEAFKSGKMDSNTFEIESRKLWQLENAKTYEEESRKRQQEVKEKTKVK